MAVTYDFHNRVAIVTGGAKGIGRSIAERLRDAGATVFVWDLKKPDFPGVSFAEVDISDPALIKRALSSLLDHHSTIDILVNNAGIGGSDLGVLQIDPVDWRHIVEVNLVGVYEMCRHVVPIMMKTGYGRVVNVASIAGKEGYPFLSAYSAAKAGVIAFTKSFGKELALTDIRVNAIAPGVIDTDFLLGEIPKVLKAMIQKSPMKRLGTTQEVAELALWLCSEACSFSTGATFDVSGGRAVY